MGGYYRTIKSFFDRNTPYANTNSNRKNNLKRRYGISISVREGSRENENIAILESLEHYYGHMEVKPIKRISVTKTSNLDNLIELHKNEIEDAYKTGKNIMELIKSEM